MKTHVLNRLQDVEVCRKEDLTPTSSLNEGGSTCQDISKEQMTPKLRFKREIKVDKVGKSIYYGGQDTWKRHRSMRIIN